MRRNILLFTIFLLVSCSVRETDKNDIVLLQSERVGLQMPLSPFEIVYIDDTLFVSSSLSQTDLLSAAKLDGSSEFYDFLHTGRGPLEVTGASFKSHRDTIHVMSYNHGGIDGIMTIPVSGIHDRHSWKLKKLDLNSGFMFGNSFDVLSESRYLVLAEKFGIENILSIVEPDCESQRNPVGFFPEDGHDGDILPKQRVYIGAAKVFCNGEKVLYVCGNGKYASILNLSADGFDEFEIYDEKPVYTSSGDGLNPVVSQQSNSGVYSCATDSLICLSPLTATLSRDGWKPDNFKSYPPYYTDIVEIYDWNGSHLKTFMLDTPGCNYYITNNNEYLYELTIDSETFEPELRRYRLDL